MAKFNKPGKFIAAIAACVLTVSLVGCDSANSTQEEDSNAYLYHTNAARHMTIDDHLAIQEMNENIGEIRNSIDNDYIKCEVCGAHVHDWWYIHYEDKELEVCQFCYQDMR